MRFPVENLVLQGDIEAGGYTINGLNKSGLLLVKADVGLGNVDNTPDLNKPVSEATLSALNAKENIVPYGTISQFYRGDKTWVALGALAFESGTTGQNTISTIASSATGTAILKVNRHDVSAAVSIRHTGEAAIGTVLPGIALANAGQLGFDGCSLAVIKTNNAAPIIFGVNNAARMRLDLGLNVGMANLTGTDVLDPGSGCIFAFGTIQAGTSLKSDGSITALTGTIPTLTVGTLLTAAAISVVACNATSVLSCSGAVVNFNNLPTSDPHSNGRLWRSTNDVKISTG